MKHRRSRRNFGHFVDECKQKGGVHGLSELRKGFLFVWFIVVALSSPEEDKKFKLLCINLAFSSILFLYNQT